MKLLGHSPSLLAAPVRMLNSWTQGDPRAEKRLPGTGDAGRAVRGGVTALLAGTLFIGLWASVAPISGAVVEFGALNVKGHRKVIQNLEGGVVSEILINDGDLVRTGDALLQLSPLASSGTVETLSARLLEKGVRAARLEAELADAPAFDPETSLSQLPQNVDPDVVASVLESESKLFATRRSSLELRRNEIANTIEQIEANRRGILAERNAVTRQIALVRDELSRMTKLFEKGYASLIRIRSLERSAAALEGDRERMTADIERLGKSLEEQQLIVERLTTDTRKENMEELAVLRSEMKALREELATAADVLQRRTVRAPIAGTVVGLDVHTIGEVVAGGQTLMEIVPSDGGLIADIRIRPPDIEHVKIDAPARLRLAVQRHLTAEELSGRVSYVAADALLDPVSGLSYFPAQLEIFTDQASDHVKDNLRPGLPVEAFIKTESRSALSYLLSPIVNLVTRALRD